MKRVVSSFFLSILAAVTAFTQNAASYDGAVVFSNSEVVFRQIDKHTWVGTGNEMWHESMYLVEGSEKAVLIDAGTNIKDLDKIVSSITSKPVMLVATHVHPDHTGPSIKSFPEIYINPGDTVLIPVFMSDYQGVVKYLKDHQIIDLGSRQLEVVFTPGHTHGSTTFVDKNAGYGFSGDSFGTGLLLLTTDFSAFIASCEKMAAIMERDQIRFLYTGHHNEQNMETLPKIMDMMALSRDVLSGSVQIEINPGNTFGLGLSVEGNGYRIIFNESAIRR